MLTPDLQQQLREYFQRLTQPVEMVATLDDGALASELRAFLQAVADQSPLLALRTDGVDAGRRPAFTVGPAGARARVSFAGIPSGHEFSSLVLALLQAGGCAPKVDADVAAQVQALDGDYRFEVFVSLDCHNCPDVVQALNAMAALNPRISVTTIDGAVFPEEVAERQIMAVPAVFLDGRPFAQGRMSLEEILARLAPAAGEPALARVAAAPPFDVLVVGGGPAGAAAAIYAARKGVRTGIVAERFGGQVLDTRGIENFISVRATDGAALAAALAEHVRSYDVERVAGQRAAALLPADADGLLALQLAGGASLRSRSIILATGARWRELGVPGEREYRGRGVAYCPHCDGPLFRGKRVAVVGGGNSGVEAAIDLAGVASEVTLLEYDDRLRADAVLQDKLRTLPNVRVVLAAQTTRVSGDGSRVDGLVYRERNGGAERQLALDGVFVQIGLLPNTDWLKGSVTLNARGEIEVDDRGQTSAPGVFAAGDATTTPYKQIIIAMGEGARAALGAFEQLLRSPAARVGAAAG